MKRTILFIGMIVCVNTLSLSAQSRLDLRACMEYALKHSTKKEMQRADYDDALWQRREALLQAFTPSVSAGIQASSSFGRTIDPETNSYISTTSFNNGYSVSAGLTLFNGFSALNNIKIARTAVQMGRSERQRVEDEICLSVMQAYYNVVFEGEMSSALKAQVETARQNQTFMQRQYELGRKGYADVVQVEADLAGREYQWIQAENAHQEALLDLKALLFWPAEDSLQVEAAAVMEHVGLSLVPDGQKVEDLVAFARQTQPSAMLAKGRMNQARYALHTARGRFLPSLSLHGGWSTNYYTYPGKSDYRSPSFSSQFRNNGGEYVQLSLTIPLYDRLYRCAGLNRSKNELRRATSVYRQTLHDIESEVRRALQDCKGAEASWFQAEKRLKVQEESQRLNAKKFAEGLISPLDFQTLTNALLNARAERTRAFLEYRLKRSVVSFYQGYSYLEQQKIK